MAANRRFSDAPALALSSLMTPASFRTVPPDMSRHSGGAHEIRVEMDLSEDFVGTLAQNPTLDGRTVYGYARETSGLRELFGENLDIHRPSCEVTFSDWGDRFLVVCTAPGRKETAAFVMPEEVRELLEHCLRARLL